MELKQIAMTLQSELDISPDEAYNRLICAICESTEANRLGRYGLSFSCVSATRYDVSICQSCWDFYGFEEEVDDEPGP